MSHIPTINRIKGAFRATHIGRKIKALVHRDGCMATVELESESYTVRLLEADGLNASSLVQESVIADIENVDEVVGGWVTLKLSDSSVVTSVESSNLS